MGISPINHNASLPSAGLLRGDGIASNEKYWEMVKQQFTVPPDLEMVNAANLCPSPYFINEQVMADTKNLATNISFQNRAKLDEKRKESLALLAQFLGVDSEEIGITRNTTEAWVAMPGPLSNPERLIY